MPTVWFIRHAQSESNAGLPTSDPGGIALTPRGHEQAECIAAAFRERPSLIVTSPYIRTRQTAQPTIRAFPDVPQAEWPVHEFTYLAIDHRRDTTPKQREPLLHAFWERCDPSYCDGVGAESFADLMRRVHATLELIAGFDQGFLAIFSHGLFARAVLWSLLIAPEQAIDPASMRRFRMFATAVKMPNAAILPIRFGPAGEISFSPFATSHLPEALATP
jgi:broad specificity phosphatase PhoE